MNCHTHKISSVTRKQHFSVVFVFDCHTLGFHSKTKQLPSEVSLRILGLGTEEKIANR